MQSILASPPRPGTIASAIRQSWRQSLPDFYIPPIREPATERQRDTKSDGHFNIDFVRQIVTDLSMLVVMGIDLFRHYLRCLQSQSPNRSHLKVPRRKVAIEIRQGTFQISRKLIFSI